MRAHSVRVKVTPILVADPVVALPLGVVPACGAVAAVLPVDGADMGGELLGDGVRLPDVQLVAARAVHADARILVCRGGRPVLGVRLAVDEPGKDALAGRRSSKGEYGGVVVIEHRGV